MRPARKDGVPVETTVSIPINFATPRPETGSYLPPKFDPPLKRDRVYNRIPWKLAPSRDDMLAAYPAKARAAKVDGMVSLDCRLNKTGGISGCDILRETPQGYGFGVAARSMRDRFSGPLVDSTGQTLASALASASGSLVARAAMSSQASSLSLRTCRAALAGALLFLCTSRCTPIRLANSDVPAQMVISP